MGMMKLSEIKISDAFSNSTPSKKKMDECRVWWNKYKCQDRYLVINYNGILIDGYVQYLVLKENKIDEAEVIIANRTNKALKRKNNGELIYKNYKSYRDCETTYVYGTQENDNKERIWRIPNSWWKGWNDFLNIGDKILVNIWKGRTVITITKIETLDKCPTNLPVKTVVRKVI